MVLIGHRASGIGHRASGIGHRASGIGHRALLDSLVTTSHRVSGLSSHLSTFISFFTFLKFLYFLKHFSSIISLNNSYVKDYFKSIQSTLAQCSLLIFFILLTTHTAQALSTTTAKAIEGSAPEVINIDLAANKQGFTVNGVFYSEASNNIKGDVIKEFSGELSPADFIVKNFYYNSLDNTLNYADKDGDGIDTSKPFLLSFTSKQWYDSNGKLITDTSKTMGCGSSYPMPLTLEITTQVKTYSKYGMPRESDYVPIVKRYQISSKPQVCYAKPYSLEIFPMYQWRGVNSSTGGIADWNQETYKVPNPVYGGGYTADYVPNMGFKVNPTVSAGKKFPMTGFPGAKFQLIVSGAQTDYSFSIPNNPGGQVTIDPQGYVLLKGKPTGDVTVRAALKRDPTIKFDYTFNPTSVWAIPQGDFYGTYEQVKIKCGGEQNMFLRSELTNSPVKSAPLNWVLHNNVYTRSIGESILSEWGYIEGKKSYPDANWGAQTLASTAGYSYSHYWTKEVHDAFSHFIVITGDGAVSFMGNNSDIDLVDSRKYLRAVCKG
ncbi:hypothetical protein J3U66_06815 [Gilliamella sp. B2969]|uniref:hypothetical protein n=1 Tax=Gilliamella sp. B2969 TaxID=2818021 RepID=UPI00226984D6|nr:hypothetical protein [Gilliamella sp. B2969]MCX8730088.1 hypothetical protein [Gilliamella sp. B2969]